MFRRVARDRAAASAISIRLLFISTMSADSMATSVPAPMARPTSAVTSAGASLMPSPTMATLLPSACNPCTTRALSWGSTWAMTRLTPTCRAMASAVRWLSPVSSTTSQPISRRAAMAAALSALTTSATAMTPSSDVPAAINSGVLPSSASLAAPDFISSLTATPDVSINASLPASSNVPSARAATPPPATAAKSDTGRRASPRFSASATIAPASGCSEGFSSDAAADSSVSSSMPPAHSTSVTRGLPSVTVPVLSSTTASTRPISSRLAADFTRIPCSAALPVATVIATGVARPRAQGHEITSTAMAMDRQKRTPMPPTAAHRIAASSAMEMTTGTNTALILSARRLIGALPLAACSIS